LISFPLQGDILVLDLQSEQHPQYNRTKSFYGQPFIWCMLHNFGGTLRMHGSIRLVNVEIPRAAAMENSTMLGVGITPEGIHQNYVVYEFALEKAWQHQQMNQKKWLKYYSTVRYGFESEEIERAWLMLLKSVYAFEGSENIRGKYTYCRRPSLKWQPWKWYDNKFVTKALEKFISVTGYNEEISKNHLFKRDLVDLTRQFLQNQADTLFVNIVNAYRKKKNLKQFIFLTESFLDLLNDLDNLLGTHEDFLLGKFLESAKNSASNDDEKRQYEFNARNQITLWGPSGQIVDYATKQWNGVFEDYYIPRWSLFFSQLRTSFETRTPFNQSKFQGDVLQQVELPFNNDDKVYPTQPRGE
jgi:alpha-N-acetylglucosaminidase